MIDMRRARPRKWARVHFTAHGRAVLDTIPTEWRRVGDSASARDEDGTGPWFWYIDPSSREWQRGRAWSAQRSVTLRRGSNACINLTGRERRPDDAV